MISQQDELKTLMRIASQCGVTTNDLIEWVNEALIPLHDNQWDDEAIETVYRIKRLTTLGLNVAGVEVVFTMRQQLIHHQEIINRIEAEMRQLRYEHEQEIARLMRQLAGDDGS